jgi:PhzF family phenazine biosynthesis protein
MNAFFITFTSFIFVIMKLPIYTVDAFTDKPFSGNPAGVCILNDAIPESLMQNIALEMNLAETAFVLKQDDGYSLRWFSPNTEIDLCGHATLASANIMWQNGVANPDQQLRFHTRSGILTANKHGDEIVLDFPVLLQKKIDYSEQLIESIGGAKPKYVGMTKWHYLIELEDEKAVRSVMPNYDLMLGLPGWAVIVTAKASMPGYDFVSRFFAPEKGVPEDPVTGSAHCALGPYWQKHLGKDKFRAYQASPRGGTINVTVNGDRVLLSGKAITMLSGEINV